MHEKEFNHQSEASDVLTYLEEPSCPICLSSHAHTALVGKDDWVPDGNARLLRFSVVRCSDCGVYYTSPRFREAEKNRAFAGSYPFYMRARRDKDVPTRAEIRAFDSRVKLVERGHPQPGRILDLGMGDGVFLAAMKQRGWQTTGIDSESDVVDYARNKLGLVSSMVADAELDLLPEGPFDIVTMWGMFQLAYRPKQLLEKVRTTLSPSGIIAIGVANISGAGAHFFGSNWRGLGLPRHLVHYDPDSLCRLVEGTGYKTLSIEFDMPYWITGPSVAAAFPLPGLLGGLSRRCVHSILSIVGGTRLGDAMILFAQRE